MVSFSSFFKLNELAVTKVAGVFNSYWQGDYHRVANGDSRLKQWGSTLFQAQVNYVNMCNAMAYGRAVGVIRLSVHLNEEKFLTQAKLNT